MSLSKKIPLGFLFTSLILILADSIALAREVSTLSFGRVGMDQSVEQEIAFENDSGRLLEIDRIKLSPPFSAEDISSTILPGANGSFRLVLGKDREPGPYTGRAQVLFKGAEHPPLEFVIKGYIIPPIEFRPRSFFRVATHSGVQRQASLEIFNHRDEPLNITSVEENSERFSVQLETIEKGQHYQLRISLDGTAPAGRMSEKIVLHTSSAALEPLIVRADTWIRERVYHFPETIDMGRLPWAVTNNEGTLSTLAQTLMVYRPGTNDFKVNASTTLDMVGVSAERGPDGDRYQLTLTLLPEKVKPGHIDGEVVIPNFRN